MHLVPASANPLLRVMEATRDEVSSLFGQDSSYMVSNAVVLLSFQYGVHCSLTSFFQLARQDVEEFMHRFTSFAALHSDSPLSQSFSSSSTESSPVSTACRDRYSLKVGELVTTDDGCVILSLSSPLVRSLMHLFCCGSPYPVKPKEVSHLTLARSRFDLDLQTIHAKYSAALASALAQPDAHSLWDVVLLELVSERSRTSTSPLQFREVDRVPLGSL